MASLSRIIDWFRVGYPQGMPPQDYVVVLGVLARRLTAAEIDEVAHELAGNGLINASEEQISQAIREAMVTPPRDVDVERVGNHLQLAQVIRELETRYPGRR